MEQFIIAFGVGFFGPFIYSYIKDILEERKRERDMESLEKIHKIMTNKHNGIYETAYETVVKK